MITIFSIPKPFKGHIATIQRNAVNSWTRLQPKCQVILFGDEDGTGQVAKEFGVQFAPEVKTNDYGTPLINDMFDKAAHVGESDLFCFVNGDIVLGSDFVQAVTSVQRAKSRFLMIGECWNLELEALPFSQPTWEADLRKRLNAPSHNLTQDLYVQDGLKTGRVMVKDEDVCLHCGLCAERCPTGAWDMQKFLLDMTHAGTSCRPPRRSAA